MKSRQSWGWRLRIRNRHVSVPAGRRAAWLHRLTTTLETACPQGRLELGSPPSVINIVALDVEDAIPTGAVIFERDLRPQLHQLFFGKLIPQPRIQIIGHVRRRVRHCVSQFNHQSFSIIERRYVVAGNGAQFLIAQTCFSAHGRIDVYSERTTNTRSSADFSQLNVAQ
jgi:hypothetical protein